MELPSFAWCTALGIFPGFWLSFPSTLHHPALRLSHTVQVSGPHYAAQHLVACK